jgi:hypothetical protein
MRVVVAGSRSITDYKLVARAIEESQFVITELIHGGARGVDRLAKVYAIEHHIPERAVIPDWEPGGVFDRSARMKRNYKMLMDAEALIAIWDGKSFGTKNSIDSARLMNLPTYVAMPRTIASLVRGIAQKILH